MCKVQQRALSKQVLQVETVPRKYDGDNDYVYYSHDDDDDEVFAFVAVNNYGGGDSDDDGGP